MLMVFGIDTLNIWQLGLKHNKIKMKIKSSDATFYGCQFNASNQTENCAIEHIFQMNLVRSDEVAVNKSVWKKSHKF